MAGYHCPRNLSANYLVIFLFEVVRSVLVIINMISHALFPYTPSSIGMLGALEQLFLSCHVLTRRKRSASNCAS